ncbi:ATP-binding protein [Streptomyces flavofungini]|uniref:ATP-binding protein n=2 Tax=Streptomyces flavofungini TaxID=68200 RepID=A0ABS0X889_9ACTN|nr:ATP-binding protein [Streptomyces flavofungini]
MSPATAAALVPSNPLPEITHGFEAAFEPDPACVSGARRITTAFLPLCGVCGQLADSIVLAVSELVTNAVRHGKGDVDLRLSISRNELLIEVTDGNPNPAEMNTSGTDEESGRGLLLVDALARKWGVTPDGTTTWCVFLLLVEKP